MGIDVRRLLERAEEMREACRLAEGNPGLELGLALGEGWREGRDKVLVSPNTGGFGLWVEQLLAESTGKEGKGLVPVLIEAEGDDVQRQEVRLPDPYELGQEFFRWEFATAVAGSILGINPFDQPDVQAAKDKTNEVLGREQAPSSSREGSLDEALGGPRAGEDYVAVLAFIDPAREAELGAAGRARAGDRLPGHVGPRPALPALDGPAAQGRARPRRLRPGRRRPRRGAADPGPRVRLPAADRRAGRRATIEALEERGRRIVRVRLEDVAT